MHIEAVQFSSASQILASARAVRSRIMSAKPKPVMKNNVLMIAPMWKRREIRFDSHIKLYRVAAEADRLARGHPKRSFMAERCAFYGVSVDDLIGDSRAQKFARVRQVIAWELHERFKIGFTEIGRIMHRDSSTIDHGVTLVKAIEDKSQVGLFTWINRKNQDLTAEQMEDLRDAYEAGMPARRLAGIFQVSSYKIADIARRNGWQREVTT